MGGDDDDDGGGGSPRIPTAVKVWIREKTVCRTQHFLPICDLNISDDINVATHKLALVKRVIVSF